MIIKRAILRTCLLVSVFYTTQSIIAKTVNDIGIIPKPVSAVQIGNGVFTFKESTTISYPSYTGDSIKSIAKGFATDLQIAAGFTINTKRNNSKATIQLTRNTLLEAEEYILSITTKGITIEASRPVGFYRALQSLRQLMPVAVMAGKHDKSIRKWTIATVLIKDKPRFEWRGFMLDVGRHFFDKEEIKRVLDIMATYKMNRFHWHLTEDQGWRIEIKKYPKLTSVGSTRRSSQIWSANASPYHDNKAYGPYFYTQNDIKEIVDYAAQRFIDVLPEIDMPGHFQAAMAAYPEYSCTPTDKHEVWTDYGVSTDVMNVANPKAVQFTKDILDELITLFPYKYIHIGGDECPTQAWKQNTECQAKLKALGSSNYRDLQTDFYREINHYLSSKKEKDKRHIIAWNETLNGNTDGLDVTIMAWIGANAAAKTAAERNLPNILSPQIPYYINRKQSKEIGEPFSQGAGTETLKAVYAYQPAKGINEKLLPFYKGVQANFWTEHVDENWKVEYLMLPRIAAVAEAGWTPEHLRDYTDFVKRIKKDSILYDLKGWSYSKQAIQ
ncbi:MAG: beta-N-acetylhexosaminidase [Bacteroidaceae bacterium]